MRVREAATTELRHRVRFAPDYIVEDPETEILQDIAQAENVVVTADDPDGAVGFEYASCGHEPFAGKFIIGFQALELVPVVVDPVNAGIVGAMKLAVELEIVGR